MDHFYIITNGHKDRDLKKTKEIEQYLEKHHKKCTIQVKEKEKEHGYTDAARIPADVDCILVLGGDGTLLQAARDIIQRDIPLLGINLGTLGYLAEIEEAGMEAAMDQLLEGRYEVEQRMMLAGRIVRGGIHKKRHEEKGIFEDEMEEAGALNDIAITRSGSLQIIRFRIYVNGKFLNEYQADGVIVATPTGSTGYNLSAGGPIVEPKAELIMITPVSPHTLSTRSIILAPEDKIEVEIGAGRGEAIQQVEVNFDGSHNVTLYTGDRVAIERAKTTTGIVKLKEASFLEILHRKLSV